MYEITYDVHVYIQMTLWRSKPFSLFGYTFNYQDPIVQTPQLG